MEASEMRFLRSVTGYRKIEKAQILEKNSIYLN
jgi:hypothetical protein